MNMEPETSERRQITGVQTKADKVCEDRQQQLVTLLKGEGADQVGFGDVSRLQPASLQDLPAAVSVVVHLSERIIDEINLAEGPTQTYFHHYRTVNTLLDSIAVKGMLQIQRWGYAAIAIPASQSLKEPDQLFRGRFSHRMAATRAGLGWIGKNGCLITPEYGPRVRLVTILTDMPLTTGIPILKDHCGNCRLCADACPAGALAGNINWVPGLDREVLMDPSLCSHYMKKSYHHIGRGVVCGICFRVCPWGIK
jgi:epoxyqueuosine reductase